MKREELLDTLTEDILAYVMHGAFPERELANVIKPEALDERFSEYELLLDLHFILTPQVIGFVEELPRRVRSLNTETESTSRRTRGGVDGKINWGKTVKARYSSTPSDRSLFVCENRTENYDTAENLVFKRVVSVIHETLAEAEEYLEQEYPWVNDRWDSTLISHLQRVVEQNVHVRRIREPKAYEPTDRMVNTALESRHEVYREAAKLLKRRRALFDGERAELETLLSETAITPEDDDTLLELFVLFRFITALEAFHGAEAQFETIKTDRQEVARLESDGDTEIVVYHDNSARDRDISFTAVPDEGKDHLSRTEKVHTTGFDIANTYFTDRSFETHTGRPDLIVIEIRHGDESEYLITEVKNSTNTKTIRQGIKETLEYLAFLEKDDSFVFGDESVNESYFGDNWNGLLVIQDLGEQTASLDEQEESKIKILQASEVEDSIQKILSQLSMPE